MLTHGRGGLAGFVGVTSADMASNQGRASIMEIRLGGLDHPRVLELLETHLLKARAETAPGRAHALDLQQLKGPDIDFWTVWYGEELLGMGALKKLTPDHYEVKSMHTVQTLRRGGIGSAILQYMMAVARSRGASRLSLETGSWDYFRPARAFYRKHGFHECAPFGDYVLDPNSVFMTIELDSEWDRP
jgi:putative acetyltransferase